jgi:amino acid permease
VESSGKHAGKRRAEPAPQAPASGAGGASAGRPWAKLLILALGVTLCVVAWGYLVYAAIDFGATARGGDNQAWWFLATASLGAVVCLFVGLLLVARLMRLVGLTKAEDAEPPPPRPIGGKRAAR